ncbi:MAG: oligoribonuclease [Myxococcales bacterium]|nr:oligoribonuclease [Myxococcales bacterium]
MSATGAESTQRLVWIDLEMTGLDVERETILEIATLVTDDQLSVIAEGPNLAIHHPEARLAAMDEWNTAHHGESGLLRRVTASPISLADAEGATLEFLRAHVAERTAPLCGNSIYMDRLFLRRHMPTLEAFFHYRNVDVSSIKELVRRWYPADWQAPEKRASHLALDDIHESLDELRFYRDRVFVPRP